ncbi:MAG: hypothetical protein QOK19_1442 [Solirubrobacteraceae bacterium]|jgi:hypothetical protein|nr:hypothetical protein [Solirubrobacterales bacterium]MEA2215881.1 hypothetical protein [Solirubrobacteraceae bacterium]
MTPLQTRGKNRTGRSALAVLVAVCLALAATASASAAPDPNSKLNKAEFAKFINCPINVAKGCLYGETLEGEFKLGSKTTPIVNPTVLQGGLAYIGTETLPMIPPRFGAEQLSKVSQPLPGGLTGLTEIIGGPVNATAELAGTPIVTAVFLGFGHDIAVELPIKVHLENEMLGPNCYIGSDAEPVVLRLTDGTTSPPAGTEPISGKIGTNEGRDKGRLIAFINNTLVDNTFAVPAAKNCGTNALLEPVITAAVNAGAGLPAAPGVSKAVLTGNQFTTWSNWVEKYDKKLLKEKEHPKTPKK